MELMNILTTIPKDDVELLPVESFICVILTTLYPIHWLTFTGVGGFFVGIKFLLQIMSFNQV